MNRIHGMVVMVIGNSPMVIVTGAALLENNEATAKSTSQDGGMAVNSG